MLATNKARRQRHLTTCCLRSVGFRFAHLPNRCQSPHPLSLSALSRPHFPFSPPLNCLICYLGTGGDLRRHSPAEKIFIVILHSIRYDYITMKNKQDGLNSVFTRKLSRLNLKWRSAWEIPVTTPFVNFLSCFHGTIKSEVCYVKTLNAVIIASVLFPRVYWYVKCRYSPGGS